MRQPEFGLCGLERVLDAPAPSLDRHQGRERRAGRAPGREVGALAVAQAAADQQPPRPHTGLVVVGTIEVGQFAVGPVVQPRALLSVSRRQAHPGRGSEAVRDRLGGACDLRLANPGVECVVALDPAHVALTRPA